MSSHNDPMREETHPFHPDAGPTGFPSPAEHWRERSLHLDDLLLLHPSTTYFMRVSDHALRNLGIERGDLVVVDRGLDPESRVIILATLRGMFVLRRVRMHGSTPWLESGNPRYPAFAVTPAMHFASWGVVLFVIRGIYPVYSLDACIQRYQQRAEPWPQLSLPWWIVTRFSGY